MKTISVSLLPLHRRRLLDLHESLAQSPKNSAELAEILNVTPRHVNRMIDLLKRAGAKISQCPKSFNFSYDELPDFKELDIPKFN